jgi:tripartite-type tricarboxylate transporter receptor subunit TctC
VNRRVFVSLLAACAVVASGAAAQAQSYPSKTIKLVVPYAAGGSTDIFARLIAQKLSQSTGAQVVVENRGGAGGNIGADSVAKAEADGYTLLVGTGGTHGINPHLYANMPFDPLRDFAPVGFIAGVPNVMVINPQKVKAATVAEFIAEAKKDKFAFASSGNGSTIHLSGELFKQLTGIEMVHVPYRGAGPALNDLIGGQVHVMFDNLPSSLQHVRAGTLRALTVTSDRRSASLPEVPSAPEAGVAGLEVASWFAIFAPAKTPAAVLDTLNAEMNKAVQSDDVKARLAELGGEIRPLDREQLAAFVRAEFDKWGKVVKASGVRLD